MTATASNRTPAFPRRRRRLLLGIVLVLAILGLGYGGHVAFWWMQLKRFTPVAEGVLYRSAQPTEFGLEHVVRRYGIRTIVSLQLFDFRLYDGFFDPGKADGEKESDYVRALGAQPIQWPMGDETCWPWPDPWELSEFFRVIDDPANRPVLIHCMGGRHRTGTFSALYRIEYDRWTPDEAMAEMYTFSFGHAIPIQELQLRTYQPRPLPDDAAWPEVAATFDIPADRRAADAVPVLVHRIQTDAADGNLRSKFRRFATSGHSFALPLASRVVQTADEPCLPEILTIARRSITATGAPAADVTAAAALIADFGSTEDQRVLVDVLTREVKTPTPSAFYEALVCGVTNRYTANRLPFLRVLLDDSRTRLGPHMEAYSYCVTAVGRIAAITDSVPVDEWNLDAYEHMGRASALNWLAENPTEAEFRQLTPLHGRRIAMHGEAPEEEDLSRMRR